MPVQANFDKDSESTGVLIGELKVDLERAVCFNLDEFGDRLRQIISLIICVFVERLVIGDDFDLKARTAVEDRHGVECMTVVAN